MDVKNITSLLKVLTWQKIVQATILIVILGVSYGFWENRVTIYNSLRVDARVEVEQPIVIQLSPATISTLEESVQKMRGLISGVQVINVDFKKNSRSTAFFVSSDPILRKEFEDFQAKKITDISLFSSSEVNNQKIINLINGEFICNDFKDTAGAKIMPRAMDTVPVVCAISIPPYYGRFSGYLNIYLAKKPTPEEISIIRQIARDLSSRIYETDVDKSSKYRYERS